MKRNRSPLPLPLRGQKSIPKALDGPADLWMPVLIALEGGRVSLDITTVFLQEP